MITSGDGGTPPVLHATLFGQEVQLPVGSYELEVWRRENLFLPVKMLTEESKLSGRLSPARRLQMIIDNKCFKCEF